jgi:hypothetical protein
VNYDRIMIDGTVLYGFDNGWTPVLTSALQSTGRRSSDVQGGPTNGIS